MMQKILLLINGKHCVHSNLETHKTYACIKNILRDPGAVSQDDVIFLGERDFRAKAYFKSRQALFSALEVSFRPKISFRLTAPGSPRMIKNKRIKTFFFILARKFITLDTVV